MYKFQVIEAGDQNKALILDSMHRLRCDVFHKELKWSVGLDIIDDMEFDEYDRPGTYYIVRINPDGVVDATCRLMSTHASYMIKDHYPEFVQYEEVPSSRDVWEISRTCVSEESRKDGRAMAQIICAAIEFGLVKGFKNYVSLTTDKLYPMLLRTVGWDPKLLGPKLPTPDDMSYSLKYSVTLEILEHLRQKNKIFMPLVFSFDDHIENIKEISYEHYLYQTALTEYRTGQWY